MLFTNNKKDPNRLHDFLISNNCNPINLKNNRIYNDLGEVEQEATEIYIDIESEKEQQLIDLVNQFMSQ